MGSQETHETTRARTSDSVVKEIAQLRRSVRRQRMAVIVLSAVAVGLIVYALLAHLDRIAIWNALHGTVERFPGLTDDDVIALMGEPGESLTNALTMRCVVRSMPLMYRLAAKCSNSPSCTLP
jgi:hypothetical protein